MAAGVEKIVVILLLVATSVYGGFSDISDCKYKADNGDMYDLSPLKNPNGSYSWMETLWNTAGTIYYSTEFGESAKYFIQLQICDDVSDVKFPACNVSSPVYLAAADGSSCLKLGSIEAAVIKMTPFKDGLYLDYYDGEAVDHTTNYEARVYMICNKTVDFTPPQMEHMKDSYQVHFKMHTKYACPP